MISSSSFFFLMIRRPPRSTLFPTRRSSDLTTVAPKIETNGNRQVVLPPTLSVKDLAEKLGVSPVEVIKKLMASDRKSTRLNSSHSSISYAVFCLKKKKNKNQSKTPHIHTKI